MPLQKTHSGSMQIEEFIRRDQFVEHKCLYELHAAAWLVARQNEDQAVLRKSARQMLFHLKKMYELGKAPLCPWLPLGRSAPISPSD